MSKPVDMAGFNPGIQGIRAIAVLAVLVSHLSAQALPGGFSGVDVFFVISGYLITGLLLREKERTGRVSLVDFYARRVRRLLPAAAVVMLAVLATITYLPAVRWGDVSNEVFASTLYVQNWWLAGQAVDYLAADNSPGPLQHFWSLSVEEQYYIFWPLIFLSFGWIFSRLLASVRKIYVALCSTILVVSLGYSIWLTPIEPGLAYFSTGTRAWELAVGGLLAAWTGWKRLAAMGRRISGWAGLLLVAGSLAWITPDMAFPGYLAVAPVLGAALLIIGVDSDDGWSVRTLLGARAMRYIGDVSYSLYLWHWPVVIVFGAIVGREFTVVDMGVVAAISFAFAHASKQFVEDPIRSNPFLSARPSRSIVFGIALSLATLGAAYATKVLLASTPDAPAGPAEATDVNPHPGAAALAALASTGALPAEAATFIPTLLNAEKDLPVSYDDGCIVGQRHARVKGCDYGAAQASKRIVLVGDSHAVQWLPALDAIGKRNGVAIRTYFKSSCPFSPIAVLRRDNEVYDACTEWNRAVMAEIEGIKADLILITQSHSYMAAGANGRKESVERMRQSVTPVLRQLVGTGTKVALIKDTPRMGKSIPECLSKGAQGDCAVDRGAALGRPEPLVMAARDISSIDVLDFSDLICHPDSCRPVVGGVLVWRDSNHLTATYVNTLTPYVEDALRKSVPGLITSAPLRKSAGMATKTAAGFLPAPENARKDNASVYTRGCHVKQSDAEPEPCRYGDSRGLKVVLVGDSHAAQWVPALEPLAERGLISLTVHTKSACSFSAQRVLLGKAGAVYTSCSAWAGKVMDALAAERPSVVLVTQSAQHKAEGARDDADNVARLSDGLAAYWRRLEAQGAKVIAIADTPRIGIDVPECMSARNASTTHCSRESAPLLARPDPIVLASRKVPGVQVLDFNRTICGPEVCPPVIDGMLVWRDSHHLTATYASSFSREFEGALLGRGSGN